MLGSVVRKTYWTTSGKECGIRLWNAGMVLWGLATGQKSTYSASRKVQWLFWWTLEHRELGDVAGILLERRGEISHPEPELAVRLGLLAAEGMIEADRAAAGPLPRDILASEAASLLLHYLTAGSTPRARARASEEVDFFDIWS